MDVDENDDEVWRESTRPEASNLNDVLAREWVMTFPIRIHPEFVEWFRAAYPKSVAELSNDLAAIHARHMKRHWDRTLGFTPTFGAGRGSMTILAEDDERLHGFPE